MLAGFSLPLVLPTMRKFSLELPKYRLQLHMKLIKRRKPLIEEPIIPNRRVINRKFRSGTVVGKVARYMSGHKLAGKIFAGNMVAVMIAGSFLPSATASYVQAADNPTDEAIIQAQNTLITEKSIQMPLEEAKLNQGYSLFHPAVDFGAETGTPIKAVKAGEVTEADYSTDGYGNTVVIDHGKGLTSRYAHLSKIEVKVGEDVTTNTEIGKVGITGRSTGAHLHLEIRQNGFPLNPLTVLSR